jgi:hypothetical protein
MWNPSCSVNRELDYAIQLLVFCVWRQTQVQSRIQTRCCQKGCKKTHLDPLRHYWQRNLHSTYLVDLLWRYDRNRDKLIYSIGFYQGHRMGVSWHFGDSKVVSAELQQGLWTQECLGLFHEDLLRLKQDLRIGRCCRGMVRRSLLLKKKRYDWYIISKVIVHSEECELCRCGWGYM